MTGYFLYGIVIVLLIISTLMNREKTIDALKSSYKTFMKLLPTISSILIFIGITLSILSPEIISLLLGEQSGIIGVITGLIIGAVSFMPSFVAFPLGESLIAHGAGYPQIAAFISSLMGVGVASIGMEIQYFGKKVSILRNAWALLVASIFAMIIWGVM